LPFTRTRLTDEGRSAECGTVGRHRKHLTESPGSSALSLTGIRFYILPPLPRRSVWPYRFAQSPSRVILPRKGCRVGLRIVLSEARLAFTRVAACTLAPSPIRDTLSEGFSYFVTSIAAPVASGRSVCRVGLAPTGKRRLITAHTRLGHWRRIWTDLADGGTMVARANVCRHRRRVASSQPTQRG
jgi:hypothetical protein